MSDFLTPVLGTIAVWILSGSLSVALALLLTGLGMSRNRGIRLAASGVITLTRGVPTSLLVVSAGIVALPYPTPQWLPSPFPGTSPRLAVVAWAVTVALALGSAGHLAVIFQTGYASLGSARMEQALLLALPPYRRVALLVRESAPATLAPLGARLVHHLHNTAFAALFPVADAFGWVQQRANDTFDVGRYVAIGVATYVVLSFVIWAVFRVLEQLLTPRGRAARATVPLRERVAA